MNKQRGDKNVIVNMMLQFEDLASDVNGTALVLPLVFLFSCLLLRLNRSESFITILAVHASLLRVSACNQQNSGSLHATWHDMPWRRSNRSCH